MLLLLHQPLDRCHINRVDFNSSVFSLLLFLSHISSASKHPSNDWSCNILWLKHCPCCRNEKGKLKAICKFALRTLKGSLKNSRLSRCCIARGLVQGSPTWVLLRLRRVSLFYSRKVFLCWSYLCWTSFWRGRWNRVHVLAVCPRHLMVYIYMVRLLF